MSIDGKEQVLVGKTNNEEGTTEADQEHTAQDHSQSQAVAAAIVSLTNEYRTRDEESQREQHKSNCWVRAGTIFVALYTGLTFFQSCVTWKTLSHTINMSHLDQRAWVVAESIVTHPSIPEVGQTYRMSVNFRNSGKTPAKNVFANVVVDPVVMPGEANFSYRNDPTARIGMIAPGGTNFASLHPAGSKSTGQDGPLTVDLLEQTRNGLGSGSGTQ